MPKKEAQRRSITNTYFSPIKDVSKIILSKRSTVYERSLAAIEQIDKVLRDSAYKQKAYVGDLVVHAKRMNGSYFAQTAAAFIREQIVINHLVLDLQNSFRNIIKEEVGTGFTFGNAINYQLGRSPEMTQTQNTETEIDVEQEKNREVPSGMERFWDYSVKPFFARAPFTSGEGMFGVGPNSTRMVSRKSSIDNELIKDAFLAQWVWSNTGAGKAYKANLTTITQAFGSILKRNINTLKRLDSALTEGDPEKYLNLALKEIPSMEKELKNPRLLAAWHAIGSSSLGDQAQIQKPQKIEQEPEENDEQLPNVSEQNPQAPVLPKEDEPMSATSHLEFVKQLIKQAEAGYAPSELIDSILKYSEQVDQKDPEFSLKLLSIVEGLGDE